MKNTILIFTLSLVLHACIDDTGNYTYIDVNDLAPITVSDIGASYTMEMMDTMRLYPTLHAVTGEADEVDEADYDYLWYVYSPTRRDTIGREKNLSYVVALAPALNYRIVFQVTNKKTGVYKYYYTTLRVTTALAEGWYVTKDIDGVTDIDIISPDGSAARDVLRSINGEGVPGEGIICADTRQITVSIPLEDGRDTLYKDHNCLYIMTRSTIQLYDVETMLLMHGVEGLFMKVPDRIAPQSLTSTTVGKIIVNDDKVYTMNTSVENIGMWGAVVPGPRIDPVNMCRSALGPLLVFDTDTRSFKQLNPTKNAYSAIQPGGNPGANNMGHDMVYMQEKGEITQGGVAIMKDPATGDHYGLKINGYAAGLMPGGYWELPPAPASTLFNPIATRVLIPSGSNVIDARLRGTHRNMDVIYFTKGDNEVWYYNIANTNEEKILTVPAGETITYVNTQVRYISGVSSYNLGVLTEKDGNWNLYIHDFRPSSPLVEETPVATYSGEGIPRHVHYRSLTGTTSF
ncbi:MAG: hypothetical protein LBK12_08050 [Odoribacteraceae bacterium]|jgi:hypothetical protein|nr:hypothetical protein [Odoribacteraceae bacterium]